MATQAIQQKQDQALEPVASRLPMPAAFGPGAGIWRILSNVIYPTAKTADAIVLAYEYAKARNLDVLKKPFHIVSTWDSKAKRDIETLWPSISELLTTAHRTGVFGGMDPARFGPVIKETFRGRRRAEGGWENIDATVEYPEWCEVTVYRLVNGQPRPFTAKVYWKESYGRYGGGTMPNEMWTRRPRGQLEKCTLAAAVRVGFPEEGAGFDEAELQGILPAVGPVASTASAADTAWSPPIDEGDPEAPPPERREPTMLVVPFIGDTDRLDWHQYGVELMATLNAAPADDFDAWVSANAQQFEAMQASAPNVAKRLDAAIAQARNAKGASRPKPTDEQRS